METSEIHYDHTREGLLTEIKSHTEVDISECYQCGKCSAGCPLVSEMDFPPSLMARMIQTDSAEFDRKVLNSYSIWVCLTCNTCYSRCPMEIDIPKVMDYLREKSFISGTYNKKARNIIAFHKAFLKSIEVNGRLHELGLIAYYKILSLRLMQDVVLAPAMLFKGKLHLLPERVKNMKNIHSVFKKTYVNKNLHAGKEAIL
jgi:heterodisulfide reductase subunit C2